MFQRFRYSDFLTPFAFEKVRFQHELASNVQLSLIDEERAIVENVRSDTVSSSSCSCLFFTSMELPCRHILKFLSDREMDTFASHLCAVRWTKDHFNSSHPTLLPHGQISATTATYTTVRNQERIDHHKKNAAMAKEIRNIASELPLAVQSDFVTKIKDFLTSSRAENTLRNRNFKIW